VDLGVLPGGYRSSALDINDLGQIVGWSESPGPYFPLKHAFLWTRDTGMVDLGTFQDTDTEALSINNVGQVMGAALISTFPFRGFFWTPESGMIDLGSLGGTFTIPYDMNNLGQITGTSQTASSCCDAFLWTPGTGMIDIGSFGGLSTGVAVNNLGHVAGQSDTAEGLGHAFFWNGGMLADLSTLGGRNSFSVDLNDADQIAGESETAANTQEGFVWMEETGILALGTLGGPLTSVNKMNNAGQVVGFSDLPGPGLPDGPSDAVLWDVGPPPPPLTPEQRIQKLSDQVDALVVAGKINQGQGRARKHELTAALLAIQRSQPSVAIDVLRGFLQDLGALEHAGTLTSSDTQPIADTTNRLIRQLGG